MNTNDWKRRIEEKEKEVYQTARKLMEDEAKKETYRLYIGLGHIILLDSVEENIALWQYNYLSPHDGSNKPVYFYTDLNGKPLFNGKLFGFATSFSQGKALVFDFNSTSHPYIIDIQNRERIIIPGELGWEHVSNFKNNRLALENDKRKWGSFIINQDEKVIEPEIPFIWDYLASSKIKNIVFPGKKDVYTVFPNYELGPYSHMVQDKNKSFDRECLKIARMTAAEAITPERFKELESYITEIEWKNSGITKYLYSFTRNPGSEYFNEDQAASFCLPNGEIIDLNLTDGSIVDLGSVEDYKGVSYKLKK